MHARCRYKRIAHSRPQRRLKQIALTHGSDSVILAMNDPTKLMLHTEFHTSTCYERYFKEKAESYCAMFREAYVSIWVA